MKKYCNNCNKELVYQNKLYCNNHCQMEYQYNKYISDWKNGIEDGLRGEYNISYNIRKYLLIKYNNKCCKCGWNEVNEFTNRIPLEIEHKDGNYRNNSENNLELLCPNCHSLTSTYKGVNKNGRKEREKYYKNIAED